MEEIELERPRMCVRVDAVSCAARILLWDAARVATPSAEHLDAVQRAGRIHGIVLFQARHHDLDVPDYDLGSMVDGERRVHEMAWETGDLGYMRSLYVEVRRRGPWLEWISFSGEEGEDLTQADFDDIPWRLRLPWEVAVRAYARALQDVSRLRRDFDAVASSDADWRTLARSGQRGVLAAILENPRAPEDVVLEIAPAHPELQGYVLGRSSLPVSVFDVYQDAPYWNERLIAHPDVPTPLLERIVQASAFARDRDLARAKILERLVEAAGVSVAFGELRSLLAGPGASTQWEHVSKLLARAHEQDPEVVEEAWLPYAEAHTTAWKDWDMEAPKAWWSALRDAPMSPLWRLIRHIDVRGWSKSSDIWDTFEGSQHLVNLRRLRVQGLHAAASRAIANTPMPCVRTVSLLHMAHDREPPDVDALLAAPWLPGLEELWWFDIEMTGAQLKTLGERLRGPRRLVLSQVGMREAGLSWVLRGSWVERVEELSINNHGLGRGLIALCGARFGALRELDLSHEAIDIETLRALLDEPWMSGVTRLNLDYNDALGDDFVEALEERAARLPRLCAVGSLRYLELSEGAKARLKAFLGSRTR